MKKTNSTLHNLYLILIYGFFYIPIFILILFSFNNSEYSLVWHGFTLNWYRLLFHDIDIWHPALNSFIIGILASTFAASLGTFAAVSLYRYKFLGKKLLHGLIFILILSPDIVTGTSLLVLYNLTHLALGFWSLLLAHITFCLPFVAITVYSRITTLDKNIFEAAKDLGANEFTIFFKILVPLLLPAILAGWLLSFTLSIDDVIISYFVTGPSFQILPLTIYSMVRLGVNPEISALTSIIFLTTLFLVIYAHRLLHQKFNR
ncbi:MAG: spermidine/putrescine ABC transporter permease PotC [Gammaproteobacteria bacterium]